MANRLDIVMVTSYRRQIEVVILRYFNVEKKQHKILKTARTWQVHLWFTPCRLSKIHTNQGLYKILHHFLHGQWIEVKYCIDNPLSFYLDIKMCDKNMVCGMWEKWQNIVQSCTLGHPVTLLKLCSSLLKRWTSKFIQPLFIRLGWKWASAPRDGAQVSQGISE